MFFSFHVIVRSDFHLMYDNCCLILLLLLVVIGMFSTLIVHRSFLHEFLFICLFHTVSFNLHCLCVVWLEDKCDWEVTLTFWWKVELLAYEYLLLNTTLYDVHYNLGHTILSTLRYTILLTLRYTILLTPRYIIILTLHYTHIYDLRFTPFK